MKFLLLWKNNNVDSKQIKNAVDGVKDNGKSILGFADDLDNYDYNKSNKVVDGVEDGLSFYLMNSIIRIYQVK